MFFTSSFYSNITTNLNSANQNQKKCRRFQTAKLSLILALSLSVLSCTTTEKIAGGENESEKGSTEQISETTNDSKKKDEPKKEKEKGKKEDGKKENPPPAQIATTSTISLLFAGDVMAHEENFAPGNFDRIWKYVEKKIQSADIAFCNLESPVMDTKPWKSYPTFNMHTTYVEQAIKAGFDVFSLANNHTNDQYLKGINSTREYFKNRSDVWAAGLREKADGELTYRVIEKEIPVADQNGKPITEKDANGNEKPKTTKWKILFVAITELLNRNDYSDYIDYYPREKRALLKKQLNALKNANEHDLFVISVHNDEPEYVLKVSEDHRAFCHQLINECGADIVWANHPHVVQEWEKVQAGDNRDAFIMYANGNTISGQRRTQHFDNPGDSFDYRGEGIFMEISLEKKLSETKGNEKKISITKTKANLITVMVSSDNRYVIRFLDDRLLEILDEAEYIKWKNYLSKRKKLMEDYLPKGDW
ncbi:MAG: CapA family protein [Treponema sp.]|nr:CapA family protein [Treponema sp.]